MTLKRTLEEYVRGWIPKAPRQPEINVKSENAADTQTNSLSRIRGNLFSSIGLILIFFVSYRLMIYIFNPAVTIFVFMQILFATGLILLVAGMIVRTSSVKSNVQPFRLSTFTAGLTLLTVGVLGISFDTLFSFVIRNYPLPVNNYGLTMEVVFSCISFAGWLLLSQRRTAWMKSTVLPRKSFSILSIGAVISLINAFGQVLVAFNPNWYWYINPTKIPLFLTIAIYVFIFIVPLGAIFTIYGWAAVFSSSMKRRRPILLMVLAVFLAIVLASLLV